MRHSAFLAAILAATIPLSACGYSVFDAAEDISSGGFEGGTAITTAVQSTQAFTEVEAIGPDNVLLVTGDTFSIKAEGNSEAIKTLRYKIDGSSIVIGRNKGKWMGDSAKGVTITITAPMVSKVSLIGSGNFTADAITGDSIALEIAGSGNVTVAAVTGKSLEGGIAGSGTIRVAGKVERSKFDVAGSGNIDATKLASTDADVSIAGSGDVNLTATGKVSADIGGSGDVSVTGGAKCSSSIGGSGKVNCS